MSLPSVLLIAGYFCVAAFASACTYLSSRLVRLISLVASVCAFIAGWVMLWPYHIDDAAISYAYARNLAEGHGFVPFIGAGNVEGFSNPAWTLALSAGEALGISAPIVAKVFGLCLSLTVLYLIVSLGRSWGLPDSATLLALAFCATSASFTIWMAAGLENPLLAATLLYAVREATGRFRAVPLGVSLGIAALTRPEGIALAISILAAALLLTGRSHLREGMVAATILIAVAGGYELLRLLVFHKPLPNTYYAKIHLLLSDRLIKGKHYVVSYWRDSWMAVLLIGILGWLLPGGAWKRPAIASFPLAGGFAFAAYAGGDWMPEYRFLSHLVPLIAIVVVAGAALLVHRARSRHWFLGAAAFAIVIAIFAQSAIDQAERVIWFASQQICSMDGISRMARLYSAVDQDACRTDKVSVATPDIGGVLWTTPRTTVYDLAMLIEPDASLVKNRPRYWPRRLARGPAPDIVFVHGPWAPLTGLWDDSLQRAGYRLLWRWDPGHSSAIEIAFPASLFVKMSCTGQMAPATLRLLN